MAPLQFTLLMYLAGLFRPGYDHVTQQISELGEICGPTAVIMNTGFFLAGLLIIAGSGGLHRGVTQGAGSKMGPFLLTIAGIGLIGVFVYRCDPGCPFEGSPTNMVHFVMFLTGVTSAVLGMIVIARRFKQDTSWQGYRAYTLVSGISSNFVNNSVVYYASG